MRLKLRWRTRFYWKLLRRSRIFNYWYKKFLSEILLDIQIADVDKDFIMEKYEGKLQKAQNHKAAIK